MSKSISWENARNPKIRELLEDVDNHLCSVSTPVNAVAAVGTLTVDTQPTAGDTMTIGTTTYTFISNGGTLAVNQIKVGADLAGAKTNIVAAINGTDSVNSAHPTVSASNFSTHLCTLTAKTKGTAGNSIATTETYTAGTNIFNGSTLGTTTAGVDGTVAEAGTMFVDASYLYVAKAANAISDNNWRRVSLGSAF